MLNNAINMANITIYKTDWLHVLSEWLVGRPLHIKKHIHMKSIIRKDIQKLLFHRLVHPLSSPNSASPLPIITAAV